MAQHKSAKKRIRQTARRTVVNRARSSRLKTAVKKVEAAIASGDKKAAQAAFKDAQPVIHSSAGKRVIARNTASRKLSRLSQRIKSL
jgi:small subunit ribosomal protein S20